MLKGRQKIDTISLEIGEMQKCPDNNAMLCFSIRGTRESASAQRLWGGETGSTLTSDGRISGRIAGHSASK